MTDNEIIKALECCPKYAACVKCPLYKREEKCREVLLKNALDLINRLYAEIEEQKTHMAHIESIFDKLCDEFF